MNDRDLPALADGLLRIGELGRRVGVRPETLRAWERRYHLLEPQRSSSGYRLYSQADVERIRAMKALLGQGVSAAEAAKLVRGDAPPGVRTGNGTSEVGRAAQATAAAPAAPQVPAEAGAGETPAPAVSPGVAAVLELLMAAVEEFDEAKLNSILDQALTRYPLDTVLGEIVLPLLREVGENWAAGQLSVGQEHFCSEALRGRLLALARGWGAGSGPTALLATPPGERHDLGLLTFAAALRERGWRIKYLGADTPFEALEEASERLTPDLTVVAALSGQRFVDASGELARFAQRHKLAIGGGGADALLALATGAEHLQADPVAAARAVAGSRPRGGATEAPV